MPWIWGLSFERWLQQVNTYLEELAQWQTPRILTFLSNPAELLAAYMACSITQSPIFLGNPQWKAREREKAKAIACPHIIWSDEGNEYFRDEIIHPQEVGWIMVATGGTSGQIKFAIHTWETLSAAVSGMQEFFFGPADTAIHSYCVLPLYHVSGLMQFMRSLLTGGVLTLTPFKTLLNTAPPSFHPSPTDSSDNGFLSLVPTQLSRLLANETCTRIEWLRQFRCILLGGAPASPQLLEQARALQLNLAPTYGMTETAAQVMTLKPEHFLKGQSPPGDILPHISLDLISNTTNEGQMKWSGPSVCWGYYPQYRPHQSILTDDIAAWEQGQLQIKGRASRKIISGGENIYPEEVESILMTIPGIEDTCVFGVPDLDWGEIAIAAYVTSDDALTPDRLKSLLKQSLAAYKCPKGWWRSPSIPRNSQGKVLHTDLREQWQATISGDPNTVIL